MRNHAIWICTYVYLIFETTLYLAGLNQILALSNLVFTVIFEVHQIPSLRWIFTVQV